MKDKQYIIEKMTIIINLHSDKEKDNESVDLSNVTSEKHSSSDGYVVVSKKKWYRKYIEPFTIYQATLGALMGIILTIFFL